MCAELPQILVCKTEEEPEPPCVKEEPEPLHVKEEPEDDVISQDEGTSGSWRSGLVSESNLQVSK